MGDKIGDFSGPKQMGISREETISHLQKYEVLPHAVTRDTHYEAWLDIALPKGNTFEAACKQG